MNLFKKFAQNFALKQQLFHIYQHHFNKNISTMF